MNPVQFTVENISFNSRNDNLVLPVKDIGFLLEALSQENAIDVSLIDTGANLSATLSYNGNLFTAKIPEDIYNEFVLGKQVENNYSIPLKLQLEDTILHESSNGTEIIFKVMPKDSAGQSGVTEKSIKTALELFNNDYGSVISKNLTAFFNGDIALSGNPSVSVNGNFLFFGFNFVSGTDKGNVILTSNRYRSQDATGKKDGRKDGQVKPPGYSFMLEMDIKPLGYIKLFSYFSRNRLTIKFSNYSIKAKNLVVENISILKDMLHSEGINLEDISFNHNSKNDKKNESFDNHKIFKDNIINERV